MASGETLLTFDALANRPPASGFASLDLRGEFVVLDFDAATNEKAQFNARVPTHYMGGAVEAAITWTSTSGTSGNVKLRIELTRLAAGANLDSLPSPHASADVTAAAPAVAGNLVVTASGSLVVGNLAAGDLLRVQMTRLASDGADTMAGDCELVALELREA